MQIDFLSLGLRFLHLFAAMTAVGGVVVWRFVLLPDLHNTQDESRKIAKENFRKRWAMIVGMCILFLLVSGLVNYVLFVRTFKTLEQDWRDTYAMLYHGLFGVKLFVALVMFFIASALAGKAAGLQKFRDNAKFWLNINLVLAITITLVGGVMRQIHAAPSAPPGKKVVFQGPNDPDPAARRTYMENKREAMGEDRQPIPAPE